MGKLSGHPVSLGSGPLSWAYDSARLASEGERTLADELGGPLAQLLTTTDSGPTGTGTDDDEDDDPNRDAKLALRGARGDAVLVETTSAAAGDGSAAAPRRDWDPRRLGPDPPETLALLRRDSFSQMLAACGVPPAMWESGADGTAQRAARERFVLLTVQPTLQMIGAELSAKLEADVRFDVSHLQHDVQVKAAAFRQMVNGGMAVAEAVALSGLMLASGDE